MAVRYRANRNKWFACVDLDDGRVSRSFNTEAEAVQWEAEAKAGVIQLRQSVAPVEQSAQQGTLGHVLRICADLDWAGKDQSQVENGRRLVRLLGVTTTPAQVTATALDDLVVQLRSQGLSNGTINRYLSALSVMLKRAQRLGMITTMPLFPERRLLKEAEPRDLVLPDEWFAELLDALEKGEQRKSIALTLFLWHMGCRVGEAIALQWDRVDLDRKRISFVKTKGCMPRTLPIPREVQGLLKAMRAAGGERVFGMCYMTYLQHYTEAKEAAADRLGLGPEVRKEWVIHTLRHTCLTRLAQRGWSAPAISQWAGHKSLAVTQRYVHGSAINLESLMEC